MDIKIGKTEKRLADAIEKNKCVHFLLIDPARMTPEESAAAAKRATELGSEGILMRPSLGASQTAIGASVKAIREVTDKPIIAFPTNVDSITPLVDAAFYISLLNSKNTYWISGLQALGAPVIKAMGLETIPAAYLVVEPGSVMSWVGDAKPLPREDPRLAAMYAMGGSFFGMRYTYVETGSYVTEAVPIEMVKAIKASSDSHLMIEVHNSDRMYFRDLVYSGVSIVVTTDRPDLEDVLEEIKG